MSEYSDYIFDSERHGTHLKIKKMYALLLCNKVF